MIRRLGRDRYDRKRKSGKQLQGDRRRRLLFEPLETRNMLSLTFDPQSVLSNNGTNNWSSPDGTYLYLPLNSTESDGAATVSYSVTSSDSTLTPVVLQNSGGTPVESLQLNVSGQTSAGAAFSGTITIQLFDTLAPKTVAQIESLTNSGFYSSKDFFRVIDNFIAQTGSPSEDGTTSSTTTGPIYDEYTPQLTFNNSPALVAMADSGHNTDNSQFFITDTDLGNSYQSQGNYSYTIFGQVTSGFDILQDIMNTPVQENASNTEKSSPITPVVINSATVVTDNVNAVLQIPIPAGYTNSSAITVTATDSDSNTAQTIFNVTGAANTQPDSSTGGTEPLYDTAFFTTPFGGSAPFTTNPTLADATTPILTTPENSPISFTVPVTDTNLPTSGSGLVEQLNESVSGGSYAAATDATATYSFTATSATTGNLTVTITPKTGYTGTANLQLEIKDQLSNNTGGPDNENFNFDVTANPVVTTNTGLVTAVDATSTVFSSVLQTTDPNYTASQLTYTLSSIPSEGTLNLNGTPLAVGQTFTQAQINSDELTYSNTAATPSTYSFGFTVTDPASLSTPASTFSITVAAADVAPTLTNTGLTLNEDTTATITSSNLNLSDTQGKSNGQLVYTLTAIPTNGTLKDNGNTLAVGSTFTQADIDNKDLTYVNSGGTTDSFGFTYSDDISTTAASANQNFAITVTPAAPPAPSSVTLDSGSNTGGYSGFNYTSDDTPQIDITATAGDTVTLQMNGKTVATATATSTAGQYVATLPADTLAVGTNSITAYVANSNGTSAGSSALSVTYAPSYSQVYTVPGVPGPAETLDLNWISRNASYNDEIGVYTVTTLSGTANGVAPGATGYAQAAVGFSGSQVIFASGDVGGESDTISVTAGQMLAFYMIQNSTSANFLANNSTDSLSASPVAFFTVTAANPDGFQHVQVIANPTTGQVQLNWEDMTGGGDSDFNDVVMTIGIAGTPTTSPGYLQIPGGGSGNTVTVSATLDSGTKFSSAPGDIGYYFVTDASGDVGSTAPGSSGYAAAALASGNSGVLFGPGAVGGTANSINVPAGDLLAFYSISSGTTAQFQSANPTNSSGGSSVAFFSFNGANPDSTDHFRLFSPEGVGTSPTQLQLHIMDQLFGNDNDYDSLALNLSIGT